MTFDVFDVVVTHFPFADSSAEKKRPAVILSRFDEFGSATGVAIIAMITTGRSSKWPLDVSVRDLETAGLRHSCVVRMKLATLDFKRIERKVGHLAAGDRAALTGALGKLMPLHGQVP